MKMDKLYETNILYIGYLWESGCNSHDNGNKYGETHNGSKFMLEGTFLPVLSTNSRAQTNFSGLVEIGERAAVTKTMWE